MHRWTGRRSAPPFYSTWPSWPPNRKDSTIRRGWRPPALPRSLGYESESYSLPYERVGDSWFSGDWFGGHEAADGSLWILVADITGHGYYAYLLASTLPGVWQRCWESAPDTPAELLAAMHDLLEDCLPDGIYVECTLVRLHPDGEIVVAPAGGSRLLLRRGRQETPLLLKMRGTWLGLIRPSPDDQQTWTLEAGDELLLATDGLFDQLYEHSPIDVVQRLGRLADGGEFVRARACPAPASPGTHGAKGRYHDGAGAPARTGRRGGRGEAA